MKNRKASIVILTGILFLVSAAVADLADAQSRRQNAENRPGMAQERFERHEDSPRASQRGMFQPRESRLVFQLEDLTEQQLEKINQLSNEHREQIFKLRAQLRDDEISRDEFQSQRRAHYNQHQEELKTVLSETQWEQLRKLRAERRRSARGN